MTIKQSATKTGKASDIVHLDTYTRADRLVVAKAPGQSFYIGRVYRAQVLIGKATEFADVIRDVVKAMPDDGVIQVSELCVPDYDAQRLLFVGKQHGTAELQSLVQAQAKVYADALEIGWRADMPILNRRQVVISVAWPAARVTPQSLEEARQTHTALLASLRACGFGGIEPLDASALAGLYRQLGNVFEPYAPVELDELVEYKYQLFTPELTLDFRDRSVGVINGDVYCAGVTCKAFPRKVAHGLMNLVTGAPFNQGTVSDGGGARIATPFVMTTTIRVANQRREGTRIEQAIRSREQHNPLTLRLGTEVPEDKLADLRTLRGQCGGDADSNKYVYVALTAFVYGRTPDEVTTAQSLLCTTLGHLDFDARPVVGNALARWAQTLPLNYSAAIAKALDCETVMSSQAAGALLPVYGDHTGNARPLESGRSGIPFITRRGAAYGFDIFNSNSTAHGFISAGSGSGKTAFAQFMVENLLAEGVMVFVLDNGRGMKNLASAVGGEFNEFGGAAGLTASLNPFTGLTDDQFDEQQETITALLMMMAYEGEPPAPGARIAMNEGVKAAWGRAHSDAEIVHVVEALESIRSSGAEKVMQDEVVVAAMNLVPRLKAFVESPTRGRYFRGKGTLNPGSRFTVFEMGGLGDDVHLRRCVVFFVLNQLMSRVRELPGRKLALIDEAQPLMADPHAGSVLEGLFLRGRKDGLAVWPVLQSLNKMAELGSGRMMMNQAAWKVVLYQKAEEIDEALQRGLMAEFAVDPYFVKTLKSVEIRKGEFAELMVMGEQSYEVVRLYLERAKAVLYSSERAARDAIFTLVDAGVPSLEAVRRVLGDKRQERCRWLAEIFQQLRMREGLTGAELLDEIQEVLA